MKLGLIWFTVLFVLGLSSNGYAQTAAIDQVRTQLMAPGGVTVQASGFWATTIPVTEKPSELRVTDGKISRSGGVRVVHGNVNVPIPPGQVLRVVDVASSNDDKSDLVRVSVQAAGLIVPVVFVFPKGSMKSMEAATLIQTISAVLRPLTAPAFNTASAIPPPPPRPVPPPVAAPQLPFVRWSDPLRSPMTKDVKAACEGTDNTSQAYCYAVLLSFYDVGLAAADGENYKPTFCIPDGTTAAQFRDAFLADTKRRDDQLESPISLFYQGAVEHAFPCAKAPAKAKRIPGTKK